MVTSAGSKLTEASVDRAVGAKARVERRSIAKATVDTIQDRVSKRAWSPAAKHYNYASWLDLKTGKIVLKTNAPASVTAPLTKDYPGVIDRQVDTIRDTFSRFADIPPFWGGSSIKSGASICSSGFVVQKGGQRYLTTAGHCFPLGANVVTTGGNLSVGTVVQKGSAPVLRHGAHRREELRVVDLRRRGEQLRGQARQRRRRSGRRLHPVLPQRPDHGRAVRADGPERQRPGVHPDRLQVAGDLLHRDPSPSRATRARRSTSTASTAPTCSSAGWPSRAAPRPASLRSGAASRRTSASRSSPEPSTPITAVEGTAWPSPPCCRLDVARRLRRAARAARIRRWRRPRPASAEGRCPRPSGTRGSSSAARSRSGRRRASSPRSPAP